MSPLNPPDPHLTALLAAAYRLGLAAGLHGGGGGGNAGVVSGVSMPGGGAAPQTGTQYAVPPPGGSMGASYPEAAGTPFSDAGVAHQDGVSGAALSQLATQQNIAATLRDDAMRDALAKSEQRRQALEISRWAQLASMRGTPTRSWLADTSGLPFRF